MRTNFAGDSVLRASVVMEELGRRKNTKLNDGSGYWYDYFRIMG